MSEKHIEVKTLLVRYTCDKCGEGELLPTGISLMSFPPKYPHACNKCGAEQTFTYIKYPVLRYEEVK